MSLNPASKQDTESTESESSQEEVEERPKTPLPPSPFEHPAAPFPNPGMYSYNHDGAIAAGMRARQLEQDRLEDEHARLQGRIKLFKRIDVDRNEEINWATRRTALEKKKCEELEKTYQELVAKQNMEKNAEGTSGDAVQEQDPAK